MEKTSFLPTRKRYISGIELRSMASVRLTPSGRPTSHDLWGKEECGQLSDPESIPATEKESFSSMAKKNVCPPSPLSWLLVCERSAW
ncbi:hypothetical protein CDAR_523351 [Caerostris darwini]|uniref:Uncharacterized protein n=1 Tax=Caerostris darwini TaxID=1538125 RepID=A0AAV4PA91_9ARAC|nr:hypothetical protein CDAR_523351 [Caerostris darwini]